MTLFMSKLMSGIVELLIVSVIPKHSAYHLVNLEQERSVSLTGLG